jgi:peptidoglycan/xylan/chitin deacetylase (PgdA/CDA1 family)
LLGHSSDHVYLFYVLAETGRAVIIEFSTAPEDFDKMLPIFQQMAESFRTLEQ